MTGWHITIGYISGDSCEYNRDQAWELLKAEVARLREDGKAILGEYIRTCPEMISAEVEELIACYKAAHGDKTITVLEDKREIMQLASGARSTKEQVRRAFCRLVLDAMHRHNIDINLIVA
jgi:hypothetical protein